MLKLDEKNTKSMNTNQQEK